MKTRELSEGNASNLEAEKKQKNSIGTRAQKLGRANTRIWTILKKKQTTSEETI